MGKNNEQKVEVNADKKNNLKTIRNKRKENKKIVEDFIFIYSFLSNSREQETRKIMTMIELN